MKPLPAALLQPWLTTPEHMQLVIAVASRGEYFAGELAEARARWKERPQLEEPGEPVEGTGGALRMVNGVAVISIRGTLFRHANLMMDISGGTSYDALWRAGEAAAALSNKILLRVNSPGGDADGCGELAAFYARLAAQKEVWAYIEFLGCSAAYWLPSQARRVVAHETARVGSIGAVIAAVDYSKADEMAGIREIQIVSSQSPKKRSQPLDEAVIGRVQEQLDALAAIFVKRVADGRHVDEEKVLADFGQGGVFIAEKALAAGMIDDVGDFTSTLAALTAAARTSVTTSSAAALSARAQRGTMTIANPNAPALEDSGAPARCAKCSADMTGKSAYCAKCYDDDEEPDGDEEEKALAAAGVLGKKKSLTRGKLVAFLASMLEATGAKTAAAAIVAVLANVKAKSDLDAFRAESEKSAAAARTKSVGEKLAAALATGKVALGVVAKEVALLSGAPKAAIRASLAAMSATASQDGATIIGAITAAGVSEEFAASVDEWIESKGASALPAAHREPSTADPKALATTAPPAVGANGLPAGPDLSIAGIQRAAAEKAAADKKGA